VVTVARFWRTLTRRDAGRPGPEAAGSGSVDRAPTDFGPGDPGSADFGPGDPGWADAGLPDPGLADSGPDDAQLPGPGPDDPQLLADRGPDAAQTAGPGPESTRPQPPDAALWLRAHGVTAAAVVLIAGQLWWAAVLLGHSYFRQDDFPHLDRALANGFTWHYLMLVDAGHLLPLGIAIAWVLARISLYNWPLACAVTLALLAAASGAALLMLRELFGNRAAVLVPLTAYLFSPLWLAGVAWWSVAIADIPLALGTFLAVHQHVRYLRRGRLRHAFAAAGWLLLGMTAADKGAIVPLLLLGVTSAFFVPGLWPAAVVRALARYWRAWLLYGAVLAGYCAIFFIQLPTSLTQPGHPHSYSQVFSFVSTLVRTTLLPGLAGGPWQWSVAGYGYAQASPPAALQQLSWAVAVLVVAVSCWYRVRAWRAWAILAGWIIAADILPVVIGRLGATPASLLAVQVRYLSDAPPVLALCLGLALLPLAGEQHAYRFRRPAAWPAPGILAAARIGGAVLLAVFLAGAAWSTQTLQAANNLSSARSYIATAHAALAAAPRGTVIVSGPTPAVILDPALFWGQDDTSQVIGAIARGGPGQRLSWTAAPRGPYTSLMMFDYQGRLRPVRVAGPSSAAPPAPKAPAKHPRPGKHHQTARDRPDRNAPVQRCWTATRAGIRVPLSGSLYRWPWTARLTYSGPATMLAVSFGASTQTVALPSGPHVVYVPALGAGQAIGLRLLSPGPSACITNVAVGSLQPGVATEAIPAVPVPG
jgi:hypothetical protein